MEKDPKIATDTKQRPLPDGIAAFIAEISSRAALQIGTVLEAYRREHGLGPEWKLADDGRTLRRE